MMKSPLCKIQLIHHSVQWLEPSFQCPLELKGALELTAWHRQQSPNGLIALKLDRGAGLWSADGKLLYFNLNAADLHVSETLEAVVELVNHFGPCETGKGIRHQIQLRALDDFKSRGEIELCVPTGGVEYLVLSPDQCSALATWMDQQEWGYIGINLVAQKQIDLTLEFNTTTLNLPAYTPDGRFIIACNPYRPRWWSDDPDDVEAPSPGGERTFGTLSVHEVRTGEVTFHELAVQLPQGWIPDEPDDPDWSAAWGPEVLSNEELLLWLPDHTPLTLTLPLSERIVLKSPFRTTRE